MGTNMLPSSLPLSTWTIILKTDHELEAINVHWPILTANDEIRSALWDTCRKLGIVHMEVAAQAARVLDCYLSVYMKINYGQFPSGDWENQWNHFQASVIEKIHYAIIISIKITYKMLTNQNPSFMTLTTMIALLEELSGHSQTDINSIIREINEMEMKLVLVIETVLPLGNSYEIIGCILSLMRITYDYCPFINFCERNRSYVEKRVRDAGGLSPQDNGSLRTLPLCAGVVLMLARRLTTDHERALLRIMLITMLPAHTVKCIADVVTAIIGSYFS